MRTPSTPPKPVIRHPSLKTLDAARRERAENRFADAVTGFAGSMKFVYIHVVWFAGWIVVGVEDYPFGLLTMVVSLEAIFLSTFILISQNRADARRQVTADAQWTTVQNEETQNEELLALLKREHALTVELHERLLGAEPVVAEASTPDIDAGR